MHDLVRRGAPPAQGESSSVVEENRNDMVKSASDAEE